MEIFLEMLIFGDITDRPTIIDTFRQSGCNISVISKLICGTLAKTADNSHKF